MQRAVCLLSLCLGLGLTQPRAEWPDGNQYPVPSEARQAGASDMGGDDNGGGNGGGNGGDGGGGSGPKAASGGGLDGPGQAKEPFDLLHHSPNIGHYANVPESYLLQVPNQNLARLRPKLIHTLPLSVRGKIEQDSIDKSNTLIVLLSSLSEGKFKKMPWDKLVQQLPAGALNNMDPSRLNAIDWDAAMPNVSPELMYQLTPRTLYFIPAEAWKGVTPEAFSTIDPRALSIMELNSLKNIPRGHWDAIDPEFLAAVPKDKLYAIDPALLVTAAGGANPPIPGPYVAPTPEPAAAAPQADDAAAAEAPPAEGGDDPAAAPAEDGGSGSGGGGGNCDDLTLAELTEKVAEGELSYPCRRRLQVLTRARVFQGRRAQRQRLLRQRAQHRVRQ